MKKHEDSAEEMRGMPGITETTLSRREFLAGTALGAGGGLSGFGCLGTGQAAVVVPQPEPGPTRIDLAPAQWLWYPSGRCLPNTFVLFRRVIDVPPGIRAARGWVTADSRYFLTVNGERVQWGPAPSDPRWPDVDPVDLAPRLRPGRNVIGATVLFYGSGDGTWPIGKPGFIFRLELEGSDGGRIVIASDAQWRCCLAKAWRAGHYRRWYLRALQEEFDARLHPEGWDRADFAPDSDWLPAQVLDCPADKPSVCSSYTDYSMDTRGERAVCFLRPRQIPALLEAEVPAARLSDSFRLRWSRPPEEYFDCQTPGSFEIDGGGDAAAAEGKSWRIDPVAGKSAALTFEFTEQIVGWPHFTIDAPAGTVVELMTQESHAPTGPRWLDTHHFSWTRFVCREGLNRFETFDYESLRWMQLHLRGFDRPVSVGGVGVRRRVYPWPARPDVATSDAALNRLLGACVNTLDNSAQETIVDGMGRERQQYSGDCGHQIHAIYAGCGEWRLPARYLRTFSEGMTLQGFFLDCWPAFDRLARVMEREVSLTSWGPLLDHGVGFNFDCWHHYLYTGDLAALREPYPRLVRFLDYLSRLPRRDGLLPVEDLGTPAVWIDHQAYLEQRHKQCAFNLYAAAMMRCAFAPIARAFGDERNARDAETISAPRCWRRRSRDSGIPTGACLWRTARGAGAKGGCACATVPIATSILFGQCPGGRIEPGARVSGRVPTRKWACRTRPTQGGACGPWPRRAGGTWLWPTCGSAGPRSPRSCRTTRSRRIGSRDPIPARSGATARSCPLYVAYMNLAGIRPLEPGFNRRRDQAAAGRPAHSPADGPNRPRSDRLLRRGGAVQAAVQDLAPRRNCPRASCSRPATRSRWRRCASRHRRAGLARYPLVPGQATEFEVRSTLRSRKTSESGLQPGRD